MNTSPIKVATDCSGIEAPLQALQQLRIPYIQLWASDTDKYTRMSCDANYPKPQEVFVDMTKRDNSKLKSPDLYVCGFPCQSFSTAGKRLGLDDPRQSVIPAMLDTIAKTRPKIIILENVKGFRSIDDGKPFSLLKQILEKEYALNVSIYNTKDYGLPQNRERVYFAGIRRDLQKKEFVKPAPVKMKSLESIIDSSIVGKELSLKEEQINKLRINKDAKYNIININFIGLYIPNKANNLLCPTIMASGKDSAIYELQRSFMLKELLQFQGFPKNFKAVVSRAQLKKQIGNSMSVCVVKKIIKETLRCL